MTYIRQSLRTTNYHIKYVPFLALGGLIVWADSTQPFNALSVIISFILPPIVYGSIVDKIENDKTSPWSELLSKHLCNYFFLTVIVIIPIMPVSYLYSDSDYIKKTAIMDIVGTFTRIATVYIWPLVFINARVLKSIPQGLLFLMNKSRNTILLILLILFTAMVKVIALLSLFFVFQSKNMLLIYGIGYLQNLINGYVDLIVFSMSVSILLSKNSGKGNGQPLTLDISKKP